jgi:hypothetical protein
MFPSADTRSAGTDVPPSLIQASACDTGSVAKRASLASAAPADGGPVSGGGVAG